jgi:hypothetical protein
MTSVQGALAPFLFALPTLAWGAPPRDADLPDQVRASMVCEQPTRVGRVRCEAEVRAEAGVSIAWGEVVVLRVPTFASALRGRIGPHEATVHEPRLWRWTFALVARASGTGDIGARVRIVTCGANGCAPQEIDVAQTVAVVP